MARLHARVLLVMALFLLCIFSVRQARSLAGDGSSKDLLQEDALQGSKHHFPRWAFYTLIAAGLLIAGAVLLITFELAAVCVIRMLGFTATGIIAGSRAAWIMSLYAGRVTVGSICAICQSIGALGVATFTVLWPLIAACAILSLLILGITECVRHGVFHSPGAHLQSFFHTLGAYLQSFFHTLGDYLQSVYHTLEAEICKLWNRI